MSHIGVYMIDPVPNWDFYHQQAAAAQSPFPVLKTHHAEDYYFHLRHVSPKTAYVLRNYVGGMGTHFWLDKAAQGPAAADEAADDWILRVADSINQYMTPYNNDALYFESLNEEYPTHDPEKLPKIVAFDRAFVRRLPVHCPGIKPVVFTAAIGNPGHDEYGALVDLARETANAGGAFGYHSYWTVVDGQSFMNSEQHQRDLHMRWDVIDRYMMERGIRVDWMLGEVGATRGNADGYSPQVYDGWKHEGCWNGNEEAYINDIADFDKLIAATPAAKEGRFVGATIFTAKPGDDHEWELFDIDGSMFDRLHKYVKATPTVEPPPPPPEPDPPPDPDPRSYNRTYHLGPQDWAPDEKEAVVQVATATRSTVGQSADDAFLNAPELKARNVVAWEVERITGIEDTEQAKAALEDFNETHYPPLARISYQWTRDLFVADRFDFPVGTKEERDSSEIPPGHWTVSTGFNQRYQIVEGGAFHRHTGWDLNNQSPYWDSDRNYPVRACANGRIIHMVLFPDSSSWGRVCIVEHELPDGRIVHTRYSHLREFSERFSEGTWIRRGDVLGIIGRTNVSNGAFHLHWDVGISGILKTEPGHWCFDDAVCVSEHYVNPGQFVEARH